MKRIKTFSTLVAIVISMGPALGQVVPTKLDSLLSHTLDSMRNVLGAKSLSAAMQLPDDAVWAFASGISSENPLVNVTVNDAYLIGSVTKTLTSACILQLHDEGVLSIDDSLHQWLDTFPYINPNITLRQLLRHTSGLHDVLATPGQQDSLLLDI
ncbi:MAG: beta-lactamase family protein, partial [Saprospiraceae bacterium]|nr:beta-lactamase family protein [Saprospiraceae bacterium]